MQRRALFQPSEPRECPKARLKTFGELGQSKRAEAVLLIRKLRATDYRRRLLYDRTGESITSLQRLSTKVIPSLRVVPFHTTKTRSRVLDPYVSKVNPSAKIGIAERAG
jgi:hypothetical protein